VRGYSFRLKSSLYGKASFIVPNVERHVTPIVTKSKQDMLITGSLAKLDVSTPAKFWVCRGNMAFP
jgi:hypothetical protein